MIRKQIQQQEAIRQKQHELDELLEEIKTSVICFGDLYFKTNNIDLSARQAFNKMIIGFTNQKTTPGDLDQKWFEIESFKLK